MIIHRTKNGESLEQIASSLGTSTQRLKENNTALSDRPPFGREILVLQPTRTHKASADDTHAALAKRFGVKISTLLLNNPSLLQSAVMPERELAIKYPTPKFGTAATNGYFFKDTKKNSLIRAMPYITYLTVGAYRLVGGRLERIFNPSETVALGKKSGKVVLMRVYDSDGDEIYSSKQRREALANELISCARSGGFSGITLCSYKSARNFKAEYADFLIELRRSMIGCDLILFTETDEELPVEVAEIADGSVFGYGKIHKNPPPSFTDGERRALADFAEKTESSKVMIHLPSEAFYDGNYIPIEKALKLADGADRINFEEDSLLCRFKKGASYVVFESLENTKAKLELVAELGFTGIAFNIDTVPIEHLMMFSALFSPVHYQISYSFHI